ncbi:MAG: KEOPS complex subunit Cgi121 [Candidatus Bilamarchaeaceae archaeon]
MFRVVRVKNCNLSKLPEGIIAVRSDFARSKEEFYLAYLLAKLAFKNKKNIAKKFKYEFLLWLTGKRDIRSALAVSEPKGKMCLLILFKRKKYERIGKRLPLKLRKHADPLALERISLSRVAS